MPTRRIPARHAAIAGYLCQLIIQTLPQVRIESTPEGGAPHYFQFVSSIPRPDYSKLPGGSPPPAQDPNVWWEIRDGYPAKQVRIDPVTKKEVNQP